MEQSQCKPLLGSILCKQCSRFIAEQDTERVTVYYVDCKSHGCHEGAAPEKEVHHLEV
ncbi:GapA-binding peptide SR1P [Paenibacillus popilliae]|uniref:GapA-binding peptide SR1P n=1 Tax=Paenibacillus popilliae TaxID=78057 RepID=UPI000B86019B|nr:GapA-binding peptide SR1P [Paenibacillus popilliae]